MSTCDLSKLIRREVTCRVKDMFRKEMYWQIPYTTTKWSPSVYGAFAKMEEKTGKPAVEVFEGAMNNIMPVLEVKARRIGGATYQVPIEVRPDRRQALALRWIVMFSRKRGEKKMEDKLAGELLDAFNNTGASVKRKEDMHKMADANRAFSHYRF